eukprot:COSAG02_NODE_18912_length_911_cov_0.657635_1_plen_71_part_10
MSWSVRRGRGARRWKSPVRCHDYPNRLFGIVKPWGSGQYEPIIWRIVLRVLDVRRVLGSCRNGTNSSGMLF